MKKMLLTSAGFENPKLGKEFLRLVGKPPAEIKVLLVSLPRTDEEMLYVNASKKELIDMGIKEENIRTTHLDENIAYKDAKGFDAMYFCGGNTPFILDKVRKSGFGKIIVQFVSDGKVYVGVSAGSIIVGPNIETTHDQNDIGMKDFTGLGLTDRMISPHYTDKEADIIAGYIKKFGNNIVALKDSQALLIIGDKTKLIE